MSEKFCNPHPCAPHGFDRTGSHMADEYVCLCDGWTPDRHCVGLDLEAELDAMRAERDRLAAELEAARADAERIDWIDAMNERFQMYWRIDRAPAGNLSVQSVIFLDGASKLPTLRETIDAARATDSAEPVRPCTCHPDDNPPVPCPRKYALSECRAASTVRAHSHVGARQDE